MRSLAAFAITLAVMGAASLAVAQPIQTSADAGAAALMNAAFSTQAETAAPGKTFDVMLVRKWPDALSLQSSRYDLRLTPHAALGLSDLGRSAEAGAVLTFGLRSPDQSLSARLDRMGLRDGSGLDQAGRWYMFAAASGRAVGLNMQRDSANGWDRSWSQDSANALIGDAQLGLGWRKGDMQTSLGLIHRTVKGNHMVWGQEAKDDSVLAFSLSVRPQR
jgi:hypothetical protein